MVQLVNRFTLACLDSTNLDEKNDTLLQCTCDFRINLSNCSDSFILRTGSWILIFHAILISVISAWFLWPHDAFHLVTISSNILQVIDTLCLLYDCMPNVILAEILADLPRQVSFAFSVLYLVGIIYSIPVLTPTNVSYPNNFVPNKHFVDIVAFCLILGPFIINTPISYMTGLYAESNPITANKLFEQRPKGETAIQQKLETVQVASTNLSTVATVFVIWGSLFVLVSFTFGVTYKTFTANNETINILYFIALNVFEPFCFQISQFIIIYNATKTTPHNAQFGRTFSVLKTSNHPYRASNSRLSKLSSSRTSRTSRISSSKIEHGMTQPVSLVPRAHLLSPPGDRSSSMSRTSSRSINSTFSKINFELNNTSSSNKSKNLNETLDMISNESTSYYSIGENLAASSRGNSFIDSNSKEINSQRSSSQLSGHGNYSDSSSLPLKPQRLSNTNLLIPID
ncbi:18270_t:CDS:2 [Dentiscutata erythropus]|uniref:18270_t:CDS:1 n=1 Tax=Dentiscutata erythropus TaxID=1348616 RepID=A0A9N9NC05_9GLOM|nr:18270_t:CDS:2 [Dentiscutata erythropus]